MKITNITYKIELDNFEFDLLTRALEFLIPDISDMELEDWEVDVLNDIKNRMIKKLDRD
jgi:hypothetical protein